ncbi:MAG TPA: AAA family ATPase [Solirubrobacteraceae bacterium]|nr:AAA family ATPase [Solirubrobacteraceae bacterium]
MHLKALTMKGFKSFPERTRLEFGAGVSVVVGPNGSGKSNVTDAVLWVLGEQSPLAVRGQSMQDVIFGGGRGVQARTAAEVELVLDNSDGSVQMDSAEIAISRRLDRSGEGEYRLNGARCRLVDVIEILSDTGLGKEMHSVISQGRVEAIVTSRPRDRRLLIEEAAGLGKHRKRRRRAQLKLERTQENLDRALDIEREARSQLRPLRRQAEAAELHERLERQTFEAQWELLRDALRARRGECAQAEAAAAAARTAREAIEGELGAVVARREHAERALAERSERREALSRRVFGARAAAERIELRADQVQTTSERLRERVATGERELATLARLREEDTARAPDGDRIEAIERELAELDVRRLEELDRELVGLEQERERAVAASAAVAAELEQRRADRVAGETAADAAREALREAERAAEAARREAARVGGELAAVAQFLRSQAAVPGARVTLGDELQVQPGYELALAAALGGRLSAALAPDLPAAGGLLDRAGPDGGRALVTSPGPGDGFEPAVGMAPRPGAQRLLELVRADGPSGVVVRRLLADAWVLESLDELPASFTGIAVTRGGRAWFGAERELRQALAGGEERLLERRNERDRLIIEVERAAGAEQRATAEVERSASALREAEGAREQADRGLREAERRRTEASEAERRAGWLIQQRRAAPEQGPAAVRRAELQGELSAERRQAERFARERAERASRERQLSGRLAADRLLLPAAQRLAEALSGAREAVGERLIELERALSEQRAEGEGVAAELRACATAEADIQNRLRAQGEQVTSAEVAAQRLRDQAAEVEHELVEVAERLGLAAEPASEPLDEEARESLRAREERLRRRREQLGPVNPLAQAQYAEALEHVQELEERRTDLETALRELRMLIRDTDRQIQETFEQTFNAAARNFEDLVQDVFPGGRGQLRLVSEDPVPRAVLGGGASDGEGEADADAEAAAEDRAQAEEEPAEDVLGVEIEIAPAGKSTKRLSLLSGGEKSMTALAFLFAVFLARPCPFYILDEVEAALDDHNLDRFLALLRRHSSTAQFIVITHQKKTMEAADYLYGVSMGGDGVSKVVSRRLPGAQTRLIAADAAA